MLRQAGYDVRVARNGVEGVRLFRERGADLVLLEVLMPEKGGIETIVELRAYDPKVRTIAMSASRNPRIDLLGAAALLGARSTLQKPFAAAEILAAVRQADGNEQESSPS